MRFCWSMKRDDFMPAVLTILCCGMLVAATVPATAKDPAAAVKFVRLLISGEGKAILEATGQPPIAPPIFNGSVPAELK